MCIVKKNKKEVHAYEVYFFLSITQMGTPYPHTNAEVCFMFIVNAPHQFNQTLCAVHVKRHNIDQCAKSMLIL
jgi:hypothetical protein